MLVARAELEQCEDLLASAEGSPTNQYATQRIREMVHLCVVVKDLLAMLTPNAAHLVSAKGYSRIKHIPGVDLR